MRNNWTREELMLAFNLYCKLPYGQFNNRNEDVKKLAELLGRTPGAIAYKLVNFVSLDPKQQLLGRKGATNIGKLDKRVFQEFTENFDEMFYESEQLLLLKQQNKLIEIVEPQQIEIDETKTGEYKIRQTKTRVHQDYFRTIVLSNYANKCAITEIAIPELLIASHIKPWSKDEKNRLNPSNGICLSATFDRAFDKGLIAINQNFEIIFSEKLKSYENFQFYQTEFSRFEAVQLKLPIKFLPDEQLLQIHYDEIFLG